MFRHKLLSTLDIRSSLAQHPSVPDTGKRYCVPFSGACLLVAAGLPDVSIEDVCNEHYNCEDNHNFYGVVY